ncbi:MAG: alpha-keto acid decarboxylase family protein [Armatimonadota bacterium]
MTVGEFLRNRLVDEGIGHIFGIPGDYVLDLYRECWDDPRIDVINNTDENHSGFAADAYARIAGTGCLLVTYSVGASKVVNAVQCAFAERSPMVVISGAPGLSERREGFLLHHMVNTFDSQQKLFTEITCANVAIDDPATAPRLIDAAFRAMRENLRPIYIEIPRDVVKMEIPVAALESSAPAIEHPTDKEDLAACISEISAWLAFSQRPVILAGVETARCGMSEKLVSFAEAHNIPIALALHSKSLINEDHPLFAGIYGGTASNDATIKLVEESDCLIILGDIRTDMALNFQPAKFKKPQVIEATVDQIRVRSHSYPAIRFQDFCEALFQIPGTPRPTPNVPSGFPLPQWNPESGKAITTSVLLSAINHHLSAKLAVIADVGDVMFGASDLHIRSSYAFLSPAYYTSMGSAIPGAVGVAFARPDVLPVVLVGDGAFQMSCTELSTLVRYKKSAIVVILNNDGYTTERYLLEGNFNDLPMWNYDRIVDVIGGGTGWVVRTESDLAAALDTALKCGGVHVLNVHVDRYDVSPGLRRVTEGLSQRI